MPDSDPTPPLPARRRALLATLGSGADLAVRQVAQFAVAVVLARLLTPEDFGSVALLGLVVLFGTVLSDLGLSTALLQTPDLEQEDLDVALWITLVGGVLTTALAAGLAWPLAAAFDLSHLAPVSAFMALAIGATAAGQVPSTVLVREAAFSRLLVTGLVAVVVAGGTAVVMALAGAGIWSLAVLTVLTPVVVTVSAFALCPVRTRPRWQRERGRRLLSRGRWVLATNAIDAAWIRVQYGVVGALFGAGPLGHYQRADSTQQIATDATTIVVGRVALPLFARSADRPELLRAGFRTGVGVTTAFVAPVMVLMAALAEPMIVTVFGAQWAATGPLLGVLCLSGMVWPLQLMASNVLYAMARNRTVFRLNALKKVAAVVLFAIGASISLTAAAWAIVGAAVIAVLVNAWAVERVIGLGVRAQLASAATSLALASAVGLAVSWTARVWDVIPIIEVAVLGLAGSAVYFALAMALRTPVSDMLRLLWYRDQETAN
ncbi:oligosaccharide flippase family protein [Oryzobacter terrae]|uniref:oligosaccharide flippase family protein n=1 Tax=Oryzobacter terrae TaxID=1620385 RepID=UPI00366D0997